MGPWLREFIPTSRGNREARSCYLARAIHLELEHLRSLHIQQNAAGYGETYKHITSIILSSTLNLSLSDVCGSNGLTKHVQKPIIGLKVYICPILRSPSLAPACLNWCFRSGWGGRGGWFDGCSLFLLRDVTLACQKSILFLYVAFRMKGSKEAYIYDFPQSRGEGFLENQTK